MPTPVSSYIAVIPFERGGAAPSPRARARPPASGANGDGLGLGLGLPIVQAIATAHGAVLTVTVRPGGGGLAAELAFPAAHPAWPAREAPAGAPAAAGRVPGEADLVTSAYRSKSLPAEA
ncbi:MAG: hypothetical protein ACRDL9_05090 [Trebonia sp.]